MKRYKYFISFAANGMLSIGNAECTMTKQIESIKDIREIEDGLMKDHGLVSCSLITYKLLNIEVGE